MNDLNTTDPSIYELFEFRPRKGDLKKMEIILAAIDCLATVGMEKTTYEAIAQEIGTRRAHVAYHFKDKHDIFLASVRFIMANYQQISLNHLERAKSGEQMLLNYVEGPFIWAKNNRNQLSVMLLFYYLCTFKEEYRKLHQQIRGGGVERIFYILNKKLKRPLPPSKAKLVSKHIQNLISGAIMDAATTNMNLKKALDDTKKQVKELIL